MNYTQMKKDFKAYKNFKNWERYEDELTTDGKGNNFQHFTPEYKKVYKKHYSNLNAVVEKHKIKTDPGYHGRCALRKAEILINKKG